MWQGYQYVVTQWFFVAFCTALVAVRLHVQLTTRHRPWREWLIVFAWLMNLLFAISQIYSFRLGYFEQDKVVFSGRYSREEIGRREALWQEIFFVSLFTWPLGLLACKALLLLIYHDLCPRHVFPKLFWVIVLTWVVVIAAAVGGTIWTFLQCLPGPFPNTWLSVLDPTKQCPGIMARTYATISFAIVTDVFVYIIPIIAISQLRALDLIQRIGAAAMFAVGLINVVSFLVEVGVLLNWGHFYPMIGVGITEFIQMLQLPTAIMVVCIPQLRVLGRWKLMRRMKTTLVSIRRGTSAGESRSEDDKSLENWAGPASSSKPEATTREKKAVVMKDEECQADLE